MRLAWSIGSFLFVVAIPLAIISMSVLSLIYDPAYYHAGEVQNQVGVVTGMSQAAMDRVNAGLIRFFGDDTSSLRADLQASGADPTVFNDRETIHLYDVRALVRGIVRLRFLSIAYIVLFAVVLAIFDRICGLRRLGRLALVGSGLTVVLVVIFGILSYTSFDSLFITFHEITFHNNFWELDPATDHLIQMFPFEFWYGAAITMAISIILTALGVALVGAVLLVLGRRSVAESAV